MSIFASHDGKTISGTAEYHPGVPVVDTEVTITAKGNGEENKWWKTRTDKQGNFSVEVLPYDSYLVVLDQGGGHRTETMVQGATPGSSSVTDVQIVELRREIHELKNSIRLRDILGGIGYILGLVGIAMYFKAKERRSQYKNQSPNQKP